MVYKLIGIVCMLSIGFISQARAQEAKAKLSSPSEARLSIGAKAPSLDVGHWIK